MRHIQYLLILIVLTTVSGFIVIYAQEDCNAEDAEKVIQVINNVCEELGDNQVCYGNFEVGADWLDDVEEFEDIDFENIAFETPGDVTDVEYIKSLYLSALDPNEDTWGIAQMHLLTPTSWGARELNLLLFGDVSVENSVDPSDTMDVRTVLSANIRNLPTIEAIILQSVAIDVTLEAVGRLEDNTWIRVKTPTGAVGWVAGELIEPANEGDDLNILEIQDGTSPYFGPMQAFVFEQGATSACGNLNSDGLVIQTPQGPASVNVSINGVNIDLIPAGENGAAAYIETNGDGTTISQLAGNSLVTSGGTTYHMSPGEQTTVGADGIPSIPTTYDPNDLNIPGLPSITAVDTTDPALDIIGSSTTTSTTDQTTTSTDGVAPVPTSTNNTTTNKGQCTAADPSNPNACNKKND